MSAERLPTSLAASAVSQAFCLRTLFDRALDALFPPVCAVCGMATGFSPFHRICSRCLPAVPWLSAITTCRHCGMPMGPHRTRTETCPECDASARYTRACAAVRWNAAVAELVHAYKFGREFSLARPMAQAMAMRLREEDFLDTVEAVVPVPLHPARRQERGFDQARLLARRVARELRLPVRCALRRVVDTRPQSLLGGEERRRNLRDALAPAIKAAGFRACLLVDDVMTTGTTVSECSAVLRDMGVERVYAVTFAR